MGNHNYILFSLLELKPYIYLFIFFLVLSCSNPESKDASRVAFKYNEMGSVTSLDPAGATSFENIWMVNQIYNGLVDMNDSMLVSPSIAYKWEISTDGLTYSFHLRSNVFFQDNKCFVNGKGRKVSSNDFVYSYTRLLDASVSGATTLLSSLNKNKPFEDGKINVLLGDFDNSTMRTLETLETLETLGNLTIFSMLVP